MGKKLKKLRFNDEFIKKQVELCGNAENLGPCKGMVYVSTVMDLFKKRKDEIMARVEKDKRKMGADLAWYFDIREVIG